MDRIGKSAPQERPGKGSPLSRRQFLRSVGIGGLTVAGTSLIAACGATPTPAPAPTQTPVIKEVPMEVTRIVERVVTPTAAPPPTAIPTATAAPVTIDWWEVTWAGAEEVVMDYAKGYQAAVNKNTKVNFQGFPADRLPERLLVSMAAGTGPAIFRQNDVEWPRFVFNKAADPLPPKVFGVDDYAGLAKYYFPGILDMQYAPDKKIYTVVDAATVYAHVYNLTALKEAGVSALSTTEPVTWEDWSKMGQAVTTWNGDRLVRSGYAARFDVWKETFQNYFFMLVRESGGQLVSPDWKTSLIDSAEAIAGTQIFVDFYKKYKTITPGFVTDPAADLEAGRIASILSYPAFYAGEKAKNLPFEIGVAPLPVVKKGGPRVTCASYAAWLVNPRLSEAVRTEAWKILAYILQTPESRKMNIEKWGTAAASPSPYLDAKTKADPNTLPFYATQQWSQPAFSHPAALEFKDVVMKYIANMIVNNQPVADALKAAKKETDAVLAKY